METRENCGNFNKSTQASWEPGDFDAVLVTCADIHGVARGRFVFRSSMDGVMKHGLGMTQAALFSGMSTEIPLELAEFKDTNWSSGTMIPEACTLSPMAWLSTKENKVGQVLCNMHDFEGGREPASSRELVLAQLRALENAGFTVKMAATAQFSLMEKTTLSAIPVHANIRELLTKMTRLLIASGIPVASLGMGLEPGQLQISLDERGPMETADALHRLRNAVRCICEDGGLDVTFMTKPFDDVSSNGISVKTRLIDTNHQCDAFSKGGNSKELSDVCKQWLSGLVQHFGALRALTRPTFNCHHAGEPPRSNRWTMKERDDSSQRLVVSQSERGGVTLEDRLPSSASNPYIVVASLIAAGLDGVERKLGETKMNDEKVQAHPETFENVLKELQTDKAIERCLGESLIRRFIAMKTGYELAKLVNNESNASSGDKNIMSSVEFARTVYMKQL